MEHRHRVRVYYEDTDFSGVVYHANYLKFFERAREHMLGIDELVRMFREDGVGFAVYRADLTFKEPAVHGEELEIRSTVRSATTYRMVLDQRCHRVASDKPIVLAEIHLVCVREGNLVRLPAAMVERVTA